MASKAKVRHATDLGQPITKIQQQDRLLPAASEQEIRRRAYDIYLERGAQPGHELEDRLQAERELTAIPSSSPAE